MTEGERRVLRQILYELMTEYLSIESTTTPRDRLLKSAGFLEKLIREYIAKDRPTRKYFGPWFLQEALPPGEANRLLRAASTCVAIRKGKSPSEPSMKKAADSLLQAARKYLFRMGDWCGTTVDLETCSLIQEIEPKSDHRESRSHRQPETRSVEDPPSRPRFDTTAAPVSTDGPATRVERVQLPSLEANENAPHLTASTVAEYAFCPRAGIVTHESAFSSREEELPSLGSLPWFEQDAIKEAYNRNSIRLFALLVGFVALLFILFLLPIERVMFRVLLVGSVAVASYLFMLLYQDWLVLGKRLLEAEHASACQPDPHSTASQPVEWWGLLKAGFEVRRPVKAMKDGPWKLSGKPHRILNHGDVTVPVHQVKSSDGVLRPQHIVRAMIHCHLIEAQEGATCPYAIVLYGDTYKGTTVPNTKENRERFYTVLKRARAMIVDTDARERDPPEPTDASVRCSGCFHGEPRPATTEDKTTRHGEPVDPHFFTNRKGTVFHCSCGDRFKWLPKHRRNRKMIEQRG